MFRVRSSVTDDRRPGAAYDDAPPAPRPAAAPPAGDATQVHPGVRADAPRLVVLSGPGSGDRHPDDTVEQVLELDRDVTLVGRTGDVHLRLADPGVSRRHLEVRRRGRDLVLTDLGSTNGTRVNGRPVQTHVLSDSDRIELGESSLVFRRDVL
jgi:pSer/pThr/pTyr-binding forkhead associated (FHA) protein